MADRPAAEGACSDSTAARRSRDRRDRSRRARPLGHGRRLRPPGMVAVEESRHRDRRRGRREHGGAVLPPCRRLDPSAQGRRPAQVPQSGLDDNDTTATCARRSRAGCRSMNRAPRSRDPLRVAAGVTFPARRSCAAGTSCGVGRVNAHAPALPHQRDHRGARPAPRRRNRSRRRTTRVRCRRSSHTRIDRRPIAEGPAPGPNEAIA